MKVGIEVQIDVTKIVKDRLYQGAKGKYLTMTTFVDLDQKDQYDNNGFIAHKKEKDEQVNPPILGNVKVFWTENGQAPQQPQQAPQYQPQQPAHVNPQQVKADQWKAQQQAQNVDFDNTDIPF